jgi:hypothetical protein
MVSTGLNRGLIHRSYQNSEHQYRLHQENIMKISPYAYFKDTNDQNVAINPSVMRFIRETSRDTTKIVFDHEHCIEVRGTLKKIGWALRNPDEQHEE